MRKFLALFLSLAMCAAFAACSLGSGSSEVADTEPRELSSALTWDELTEAVDFDEAERLGVIITAEDGDVLIRSDRAPWRHREFGASTSFRSMYPPDMTLNFDNAFFTMPHEVEMPDGSLGHLHIPKIGLTVQVFHADDTIESMLHGVAHMKETSSWAGNVGIAGHDSGINTYFAEIHTLIEDDIIQLTTALGVRRYRVITSVIVDQNDWSYFHRTEDNRITLLTCVQWDGTKRLIVQAVEIV